MRTQKETNGRSQPGKAERRSLRIWPYLWALWATWTIVVSASLMWNVHQTKNAIMDLARSQARVGYEKDIIYRRWNASHGGVYVPVTEKSPPNPYLKVPDRDIVTPSGVTLTMLNPAYMTRQANELAANEYGVQGHITSLNPIRPGNAPDPWEAGALRAFQEGVKEVSSVEQMRGEPYLRLMRPLITEHSCLKCHADQGYKEGEIRGGISVSLPMAPLRTIEASQMLTLWFGHILLWLCGLSGLGFATRRLGQYIRDRRLAEEAVLESAELLKATLESTADGILAVNEKNEVTGTNTKFREMWRIPDDLLITKDDKKLLDYVLDQLKEPEAFLKRVQELYASSEEDFDTLLFKDGRVFDRFSCPLIRDGRVSGRVWSFRDITRQNKGEAALRRSEQRYRLLAENVSDVIFTTDLNLKITYISPSVERMHGWTVDEWQALAPSDYLTPASLELALKVLTDEIALQASPEADPNRVVTLELEQYRKDGTAFWTEVSCRFLLDNSATPIGISGATRDISERKRAEDARRLNESRMETLLQLNQMTDATMQQIADFAMEEAVRLTQSTIGYVAFVNESETVLTMHGWSRLAMQDCRVAHKPLEFPVETTGLLSEAVRRRRAIITNDYDAPNPLKRGIPEGHVRVKRHMSTPIFDGDRIVVIAGVGNKPTDYDQADVRQLTLLMSGMWRIVQRKQAEKALRESRERFQELAELLPETIFEMDTDGNLTFVNKNAFTHFGFSQEDLERGLNVFDFVAPEDHPRGRENVRRIMSGERIGLNEYKALRKDGSTFPAILHSSAKYSDGKPVGLRGIVIDITETKKLEAQLRQAHKMEAVGTLAGGIAHDFNNLLQAVQGYAELLLLPKKEGEEGYRELQEISRAARRGGELTRQLLTFSRKVESKLQTVDLNRIVEDVRLLLERTIPKMIKIELHLTGNLHRVNADASQIEQVLMNLAVNARDAMPDGGTFRIETNNVTLDEEFRRRRPELTPGNYVLLAASDTGKGMDEDTLESIFDPFFTTKEVGKGTGLGLAMVYGIIKNHHGYVTCSSKPGLGAVFEIYLPAVEKVEREPAPHSASKQTRGGNETILLVDDDDSLRDLGAQALQAFGYTVVCAPDGEGALQIYQERKDEIGLVILDLIMPGMGGAQCLEKLLQANPEVKVVIASGYFIAEEVEKAKESGARAFIKKPYDVRGMIEEVRKVFDE